MQFSADLGAPPPARPPASRPRIAASIVVLAVPLVAVVDSLVTLLAR